MYFSMYFGKAFRRLSLLIACYLGMGQAFAQQANEDESSVVLSIVGTVKTVSCTVMAIVNEGKPTERIKVTPLAQHVDSVSGVAYFSIGVRELGNSGNNCLSSNKLSAIKFDNNSQNKILLASARTGRQPVNTANLAVELILFNSDWTKSTVLNPDGNSAADFSRTASSMNTAPSAAEEKLNFAIRYTVSSSGGLELSPGDYFVTLPFVVAMN